MKPAAQLLIVGVAAWVAALPAGVIGTGLRGGSALLNAAGVLAFALPMALLAMLLGIGAYFIARRVGGNPLLIGVAVALAPNLLEIYEMAKQAG